MYILLLESNNARIYYEKRLRLRKTNDTISHYGATKCGKKNANNKDYNNALAYYNESGILFKKLNYEIGTAYNIGNKGMLYAETGDEKSNESD
jgi:hypothetical protein